MKDNCLPTLDNLIDHLKLKLESQPVLKRLEIIIEQNESKAGKCHEEVFTREFLCPAMAYYFYKQVRSKLNLTDDEIKSCLGAEGGSKVKGFGFSPAGKKKHFFTKNEIIKNECPEGWKLDKISEKKPCPDFALKAPLLPCSLVGEVKYFHNKKEEAALTELYNACRQAVFYLGAFKGYYKCALIVVADATREHYFARAFEEKLNPEIRRRFGSETGIYILIAKLR